MGGEKRKRKLNRTFDTPLLGFLQVFDPALSSNKQELKHNVH